ncbi:MAG: FeoC-like transcriptional regulator [Thermodesulfobacteriota bacterium]
MILTELKKYLMARRVATLQDIACHFNMEPETIRPMLEKWLIKGKARRHANNLGCAKGCCKCDPAAIETYEWIG